MGLPLVHTMHTPRRMPMVASVTIKEGIRPYTTSVPFSQPTARPISSAAPTPRAMEPLCRITQAAATPLKAAVEPTDRSISPDNTTHSMPMATVITMDTWRVMFKRLRSTQK